MKIYIAMYEPASPTIFRYRVEVLNHSEADEIQRLYCDALHHRGYRKVELLDDRTLVGFNPIRFMKNFEVIYVVRMEGA